MKTQKKRKKPLVRTDYVIRRTRGGKFWTDDGFGSDGPENWGSFSRAIMHETKPCVGEGSPFPGCEVVAVRCRPLSTKTKAARKRTR